MRTEDKIEIFLALLLRAVEAHEALAEQHMYIAISLDEINTRAREEGSKI